MAICEFCVHRQGEGRCQFGLRIPSRMSCREFTPGIEKFCANPDDFVDSAQILHMAKYFGMKGTEMKKISVMVSQKADPGLTSPGKK